MTREKTGAPFSTQIAGLFAGETLPPLLSLVCQYVAGFDLELKPDTGHDVAPNPSGVNWSVAAPKNQVFRRWLAKTHAIHPLEEPGAAFERAVADHPSFANWTRRHSSRATKTAEKKMRKRLD